MSDPIPPGEREGDIAIIDLTALIWLAEIIFNSYDIQIVHLTEICSYRYYYYESLLSHTAITIGIVLLTYTGSTKSKMVFYSDKLRVGTYVACVAGLGLVVGGDVVGLNLMTGVSALKVKKLGTNHQNDQSDQSDQSDVDMAHGTDLGVFAKNAECHQHQQQAPEEEKKSEEKKDVQIHKELIQIPDDHDDEDGYRSSAECSSEHAISSSEGGREPVSCDCYHCDNNMLDRALTSEQEFQGLLAEGTFLSWEGLPTGGWEGRPPSLMTRQFHRSVGALQTILAFLAPHEQQVLQQVNRIFAHEHVPAAMRPAIRSSRYLDNDNINNIAPAGTEFSIDSISPAAASVPFKRTPLYLFEQMKQRCRPGDVSYHQALDRLLESAEYSMLRMCAVTPRSPSLFHPRYHNPGITSRPQFVRDLTGLVIQHPPGKGPLFSFGILKQPGEEGGPIRRRVGTRNVAISESMENGFQELWGAPLGGRIASGKDAETASRNHRRTTQQSTRQYGTVQHGRVRQKYTKNRRHYYNALSRRSKLMSSRSIKNMMLSKSLSLPSVNTSVNTSTPAVKNPFVATTANNTEPDSESVSIVSQMFLPDLDGYPSELSRSILETNILSGISRPRTFMELQCWEEDGGARRTSLLLRRGNNAVKFVVEDHDDEKVQNQIQNSYGEEDHVFSNQVIGGNDEGSHDSNDNVMNQQTESLAESNSDLVVKRTRFVFARGWESPGWRDSERGDRVRVVEKAQQVTRGGEWEVLYKHVPGGHTDSEEYRHY